MTRRQILYLSAALLIVWVLAITILRSNFGTSIRFFADESDWTVYFERGLWLPTGQVPYRDVLSEYPQIPTLLFGLFHAFVLGEENEVVVYLQFTSLLSLAMLIVLFALVSLVYRLLPDAKYRAFLLLLPAPLYFAFNRFDILPAYLCLVSFLMIKNRRWGLAAAILGIATMTKWYPVLLLPAFVAYSYYMTRRIPWQMILIFSMTCFFIVLPTLLSGGMEAVLVPYRFQGIRGLETVSLPAMISKAVASVSKTNFGEQYYIIGFLFLQTIAGIIAFFFRPDGIEKLLQWCILIITLFVLFSRIYSPQWCLWILPFLILASKTRFDVALLIFYGIMTYVGFPVVYDLFGGKSAQMIFMGLLNSAVLFLIAGNTIRQLWFSQTSRSIHLQFLTTLSSSPPARQE